MYKKYLILLIITIVISPLVYSLIFDVNGNLIPDTSVYLLLHFNGNTSDSSGKGNNGNAVGNATSTTIGKLSEAFTFDGDGDYISLPKIFNMTRINFTISSWAKTTKRNSDVQSIFARGGNIKGAILYIENNTARFALRPGGTTVFIANSDLDVSDSWHYIVGIFEFPLLKLYIDGELKNITIGNYIQSDPDEPAQVGADLQGSVVDSACCSNKDFFNGTIDEVIVFNRAINNTEVLELFNAGLNDEDKDGIKDKFDMCLNSKENEPVDQNGCDIFQFCGQEVCGINCFELDFINNEPNEKFPRDCTVVIPSDLTGYPKCAPTKFSSGCDG